MVIIRYRMVKYLLKMGGTKLLLQRIDGSNLSALHYVSCCPSNFQVCRLDYDSLLIILTPYHSNIITIQ